MKNTIAIAASAILMAIAIGGGYLKTRHAEHATATLESSLSTMSIQDLSVRSKQCDDSPAGRESGRHDSDYCTAVWREIEARPLQIVESPEGTPGEPAQDHR
ncbi:MAG: hypothetical protein WA803_11440 [Steroidobacteraceae bacterium]